MCIVVEAAETKLQFSVTTQHIKHSHKYVLVLCCQNVYCCAIRIQWYHTVLFYKYMDMTQNTL